MSDPRDTLRAILFAHLPQLDATRGKLERELLAWGAECAEFGAVLRATESSNCTIVRIRNQFGIPKGGVRT